MFRFIEYPVDFKIVPVEGLLLKMNSPANIVRYLYDKDSEKNYG